MNYDPLALPGLILFKPVRFEDKRGYFSETFRQSIFEEAIGQAVQFVQDNRSFSESAMTVRGLHYQAPPRAQGKLVQCTQGAITDIAVDIRKGSPTYGQHICIDLSAKNGHQLWVPAGFLHGFITREDNTAVQYKCTDYYVSEYDRAVLWNDKDLGVDWQVTGSPIVSNKDANAQAFAEFKSPFIYEASQ